ncbi:polyketide synthase docking domain-containing protein, partial [Micromonospora sp. NPDC049081]|nr:polyketide synthase docking domain-containing protein [Micromonospora antibiotica]
MGLLSSDPRPPGGWPAMANEDKLREYLKRVTTDLQQTRRRLAEVEGAD